jgi:hypothetical protein
MMTTTHPMTRSRNQQPTEPSEHSLLKAMPTHQITLSPDFLHALKGIAPKRRRGALWVLVLALAAAAISVGIVPSARQRVLAALVHRVPAAISASTPTSAPSAPSAPKLDAVPAESTIAELAQPAPTAAPNATAAASTKPTLTPRKSPQRAPR